MRMKQRKLNDMINHVTVAAIHPQEDGDELNELEKLAGIEKLEISDDEADYPQSSLGLTGSERPDSAGGASSYSDFMAGWKSKLQNDIDGVTDVVSNHSG